MSDRKSSQRSSQLIEASALSSPTRSTGGKPSIFSREQTISLNGEGATIITKVQQNLSVIQGILNKPSKNRTERDLEQLVPLIKSIQFFKERDIKDADFPDIVSCLTYEFIQAGKEVFEYGSMGDKFYIILSGKVTVIIPNPDCRDFKSRFEHLTKYKEHKQNQAQALSLTLNSHKSHKVQGLQIRHQDHRNSMSTTEAQKKFSQTIPNQLNYSSKNIRNNDNSPTKISQNNQKQGKLNDQPDLSDIDDAGEDNEDLSVSGIDDDIEDNFEEEKKKIMLQLQKNQSVKYTMPRDLATKRTTLKQTDHPLFIETSMIKSGKAFGELALIKNKPRAATIKCAEDCHFAVMSKGDFEKVLQKIEQKTMNKIIEFLHQLPYFRVWTRTSLGKLQYSFEQKSYIRNQIVYREGEAANMIFIIKSGEFEVNKKFKREEIKEIDAVKLIAPKKAQSNQQQQAPNKQDDQSNEQEDNERVMKSAIDKNQKNSFAHASQMQLAGKQRNFETFKLSLIGPGQIFGEDDVVHERPYSSTIICRSNQGIVLSMKAPEFFRKLKSNDECWKIILTQVNNKEIQMNKRMNKLDFVFHKEQVNSEQEKRTIRHNNQNDTRQKQYPSILQKHNMNPTQQRIDDFRETLKEIVQKQRMDGSLEENRNYPDTAQRKPIEAKESDNSDQKLRHSYNLNKSVKNDSRNGFDSPLKIYKEDDQARSHSRVMTQAGAQRKYATILGGDTSSSPMKSLYNQPTFSATCQSKQQMYQTNNNNEESFTQYSNAQLQITQKQHLNLTLSNSPIQRQMTGQYLNRSEGMKKQALKQLTMQRIMMMNSRKGIQESQSNDHKKSRQQQHEKSASQMFTNSYYQGSNSYMSVAHTLKPSQLKATGSQSINSITPHLLQYGNISRHNFMLKAQQRAQSNEGTRIRSNLKREQTIFIANQNSSLERTVDSSALQHHNPLEVLPGYYNERNGIKEFTNVSITKKNQSKSSFQMTQALYTFNSTSTPAQLHH